MILNVNSSKKNLEEAIQDIAREIESISSQPILSILFVSSCIHLEDLEKALADFGPKGKVLACTTSGEISPLGISNHGIVGQVYFSDEFLAKTFSIQDLNDISNEKNILEFSEINNYLSEVNTKFPGYSSFGVMLVDGMSGKEEEACSLMASCMGNLPVIGGSAGDDLGFDKTYIYEDGVFRENYATLIVLSTLREFEVFKSQHFESTDKKMVITSSIPEQRIVQEINGEPAALFYATMLNKEVKDLDTLDFSKNPLVLEIGGEPFVRSIQKVNEDGSLTFYCAIDTGIVMVPAKKRDLCTSNETLFENLNSRLEGIESCLLFECILRKIEILELSNEDKRKVEDIYKDNNAIGFYTYGEQFDHVHINQTLTGVAFGKRRK